MIKSTVFSFLYAGRIAAPTRFLAGILIALGLQFLLSASSAAQEQAPSTKINTSVILPAATGAAQIIYNEVLQGVTSHPELNITVITLQPDTTIENVEQQVKSMQSELVIAIGNKSYKLAKTLNTSAQVIAGGISGKPNGIPTVSLTGDPEPTLAELKRIAPHINNIRLVYNESINGWWYERAKQVEEKYDLNIIGYVASDIKDGVKLYEQLLDEAPAKTTAVWIPLRSVVPSKTILPLLLEKAWGKKLAVISNNPSHTKLGGLIALYPEHNQMGRQLADFAVAHFRGTESEQIVGTQALRVAINLRTSSHIGLRLSAKDRNGFDKIFPTKR